MTPFLSFLGRKKLPTKDELAKLTERPLSIYGVIFSTLAFLVLVTLYILLVRINSLFLIEVPARGGSITEGMIGAPIFINPILAKTDTDIALANLVYSGLMKENSDESIVTDLADSYEISPDGTKYHFTLKKDLYFSDGKPLTSTDVLFTFKKLSSVILRGTGSTYWQNILIENNGEHDIYFTLPSADTDFLSLLTIGILPVHIWGNIEDQDFEKSKYNLSPIGSGLFKYSEIVYENGIAKKIILKRNSHNSTKVHLDEYKISFFSNEEDLIDSMKNGYIDMTIFISPKNAVLFEKTDFEIEKIETNKYISIYHLKKEKYFSNQKFVAIINNFLDKSSIIDKVEDSYGTLSKLSTDKISLEEAFKSLSEIKYKLKDGVLQNDSPVVFGIATENSADMLLVSEEIKSELSKLGIEVIVKPFDIGTFQEGIKQKEYSVFLANGDNKVPQDYESVVPIYIKNIPIIKSREINISIPTVLRNINQKYANIDKWYAKTDKVWKFLNK